MNTNEPTTDKTLPVIRIQTAHTGASNRANGMGMRPMQERAYARRGEQYLLIKSPPASGKSRALMFIALDKLHHQGLQQAIIVVPERSIGGSFASEPLSQAGFEFDWEVKPQWNLCNTPDADVPKVAASKVKAVAEFLNSDDRVLVCTHATFRFAVEELGTAAFDNRLIAVDEFHHVSASPDNRLGSQLGDFIRRDKVHIVAMTGSYFRGDSVAVLNPADEARFDTVTYTYFEQLNGYDYLKALELGYYFYKGRYLDDLMQVLNPEMKTIIHIPSVNSRESLKDKHREVEEIMSGLGEWLGKDPATGFDLIQQPADKGGRVLKIADLVDDSDSARRTQVLNALKDPAQRQNRDHVDIIVALGMAKEGFDWIWCEHALTIGYRSSLTEVIQIIGRATRDAPGKAVARFSNLIAEPDAEQGNVAEAVNDMLKAIAASLLMEQVMAPRFDFTLPDVGAQAGFDYGENGYQSGKTNVGFNAETGQVHIEIKGLNQPKSLEAQRICKEDLNELVATFVQDKVTVERGVGDEQLMAQELTQLRMGKIVSDRYPEISPEDQEAIRQQAVAAVNLVQQASARNLEAQLKAQEASQHDQGDQSDNRQPENTSHENDESRNDADEQEGGNISLPVVDKPDLNLSLLEGVRRFVNVRDLNIDLIDSINPFASAYMILSRTMEPKTLEQIHASITGKKLKMPYDEARDLAKRAIAFKNKLGRMPSLTAADPFEKLMAEAVVAFARYKAAEKAQQGKQTVQSDMVAAADAEGKQA